MKMPKVECLSFNQYLNIKKGFLKNAIKNLEETKEKESNLSDEFAEATEMLQYQKKELKQVDSMLRYEKCRKERRKVE